MKKLLSLGLMAPLAAAGALSVSSAASAANLFATPPNQLSINVVFDIVNLDLVRTGTGGYQFVSPNPLIDFIPPIGTSSPSDISVAGIGNLGTGFGYCNTVSSVSTTCDADIYDFQVGGLPNPVDPFIVVNGIGTQAGNLQYTGTLDKTTITDPTPGSSSILKFTDDGVPGGPSAASCQANPFQAGCAATIDFFASGMLTVNNSPDPMSMDQGNVFNVFYSYSGPRILIDAASSTANCGAAAGSTCTLQFFSTSGSGNLLVTTKAVPESSNVGALLALGVLGSFGVLKRKKLGK